MPDQAEGLRRLFEIADHPTENRDHLVAETRRAAFSLAVAGEPARPTAGLWQRDHARSMIACRTVVMTSGKGGVGTSSLALSLAIALRETGLKVVLIDADAELPCLDLLCGMIPRRDLGDVAAGACSLAEAAVEGPAGIRLVPGARRGQSGLPRGGLNPITADDLLGDARAMLATELAELDTLGLADVVLIDAGRCLGSGASAPLWAALADELLVVATPESTALAGAYAAAHQLAALAGPDGPRLLINQANSEREAQEVLSWLVTSSRRLEGLPMGSRGYVRWDPAVGRAVRAQQPFLIAAPRGPAAQDVRRIAREIARGSRPPRSPQWVAAVRHHWNRLWRPIHSMESIVPVRRE